MARIIQVCLILLTLLIQDFYVNEECEVNHLHNEAIIYLQFSEVITQELRHFPDNPDQVFFHLFIPDDLHVGVVAVPQSILEFIIKFYLALIDIALARIIRAF